MSDYIADEQEVEYKGFHYWIFEGDYYFRDSDSISSNVNTEEAVKEFIDVIVENGKLQSQNCGFFHNVKDWNTRPLEDALTAENAKLREALKFYANKDNYLLLDSMATCIDNDEGERACAALSDKEVK
jgi:hypothetical protein